MTVKFMMIHLYYVIYNNPTGRNHGQKSSDKIINLEIQTHENSAYTFIKLKDVQREEVSMQGAS